MNINTIPRPVKPEVDDVIETIYKQDLVEKER